MTELFDEALRYAAECHSGQTRSLSKAPYVLHPMEAAVIVGTMTADTEILAAALLHDTIEDTGATLDEIRKRFGDRVAELVASETETRAPHESIANTWEARKSAALSVLRSTDDIAVKMLWLGDKLSNMRSFAREYRLSGNALWARFHQKDPAKQAWYYREIIRCMNELREYDAYKEFAALVEEVFQDFMGGNES